MTTEEALNKGGKEFKLLIAGARFDIIREVKPDGTIIGDFTEAHCNDCRLKLDQPEHLKKQTNEPQQRD